MSITDAESRGLGGQETVLCTTVLGGAEIFTLERMLPFGSSKILHCNESLASQLRLDPRYEPVELRVHPCLDALAERINLRNINAGARGLEAVLNGGNTMLGNLRAAALTLHPIAARKNDAFIHDNSHYLNLKTRTLVAAIVAAARTTYFPCKHSISRVPLRAVLSRRMRVDYFSQYQPLPRRGNLLSKRVKIAMVGRIEPAKNQQLGLAIANILAGYFESIHLTLLGARSDEAYASRLLGGASHPGLTISQQELPRSGVPDFLSEQDLVLHTSIAESLPLVLFETNARGVPFFALPVGGIPEILPRMYWLGLDASRSALSILAALGASNVKVPSQRLE